jgi:methionyl-tRNA formyltransferase
MKIAVICNTDLLAIPTINQLLRNGSLSGVGTLQRNRSHLEEAFLGLGIAAEQLAYFTKQSWKQEVSLWLNKLNPDMVWVFGFPWQFTPEQLSVPAKGFYNFHFGLFPKYKGADPMFWQLKNREDKAGFVIHQVNEEVDGGPVVWREEVPLVPGENYGLYCQRMGFMASGIIDKLLEKIEQGEFVAQEKSTPSGFEKKPVKSDLSISWKTQSAEEIEWLVNACNPAYGGASTWLRGQEVKLLEITPADVNDAPETEPGTVIYADALYGLIVSCNNKKFIRVNIISLREGYMSGAKLFALGVKPGDRFYDNTGDSKNNYQPEARSL